MSQARRSAYQRGPSAPSQDFGLLVALYNQGWCSRVSHQVHILLQRWLGNAGSPRSVYWTKCYLALWILFWLLIPCIPVYAELSCLVRKYRGRTPATSTHPSRSSFEKHWQDMKAQITEAPKNHTDAKNLVSKCSTALAVSHHCPWAGPHLR